VQGASNLRQIGLAVQLYANDHQTELPPDLGATYSYVGSPAAYLAPDRFGTVALPTGDAAAIGKWVNENSDYVYVGAKFGKYSNVLNAPETVFAHEKFEAARGNSVNVLYADGHVAMMPVAFVKERVEAQAREREAAKGL
jgi:prepilin-type processing-associated H-X9-DG protein